MIRFSEVSIPLLSIHYIGNKANNEHPKYTNQSLVIDDLDLMEALRTYFLDPWKMPDFHQFTFLDHALHLNPVYQYCKSIFQDPDNFHDIAQSMASFLYEKSAHPNIKSGDLLIGYLDNIGIEDEVVNGLALFKSENKDQFLTMNWQSSVADIAHSKGIALHKIDKACLVLNTDSENGFKVLSMDKSNKGQEAVYWKEHFLGIRPRSNDFHHTQQMIQVTKSFIDERLKPLNEIDKSEEAAILHRSKEFFKKAEGFDRNEYQEKLFQAPETQSAFEEYMTDYQESSLHPIPDQFAISPQAVKQQNKVFKSVIKLDKNFHIYVHGDRRLIERGQDEEGRKFYKIYFEKEQ